MSLSRWFKRLKKETQPESPLEWFSETKSQNLLVVAERYDPKRALAFVRNRLILRRIRHLMPPETPLETVELVHRFIEFGKTGRSTLVNITNYEREIASWRIRSTSNQTTAYLRAYCSPTIHAYLACGVLSAEKEREECELIREAFYPFPITIDPAWATSTVVSLLKPLLNDNAFHLMPILADALEDAGCDAEAVLSHCRHNKWHCDFVGFSVSFVTFRALQLHERPQAEYLLRPVPLHEPPQLGTVLLENTTEALAVVSITPLTK